LLLTMLRGFLQADLLNYLAQEYF